MYDQIQQQPVINPDFEQLPIDEEPQSETPELEPEISIQNGQVKFRDDFFGDVRDEPIDDENNLQPAQSLAPNYYTDEELQNTPFEQWDRGRMPDDVKRYVDAYLSQREAQARQQKFEQDAQSPTPFLQAPKQYTPKELNSEAVKLAIQKLGLNDPDEFDEYESEHRTALDMARQELIEKNYSERVNYQRAQADWAEHQRFNAQLAAQPDFAEFNQWYVKELKKYGYTPQQMNASFEKIAREQGLAAVRNAHLQLYQEFIRAKANNAQQRPRAKTPPTLESTHGGNYEGRKSYNMRDFSKLDDDEQAQALIDMGIVK